MENINKLYQKPIIIYSTDKFFFWYLYRVISKIFEEFNIEHKLVFTLPNKPNDLKDNLYIIGFDYLKQLSITKENIMDYIPKNFVYYHSEAIDHDLVHKSFTKLDYIGQILPKAYQIWNYSRLYDLWFKEKGMNSIFVPLSYNNLLDMSNKYINNLKKIDVLCLYGSISKRRQKNIDLIREKKINVFIPKKCVYGEELDLLVSQAKIIISVHYSDIFSHKCFDFCRLSQLISKKAVIVAESSNDPLSDKLFADNINIVSYDDIPEKCFEIINNYKIYSEKSDKTYEWFKVNFKMNNFIINNDTTYLLQNTNNDRIL